MWPTPVNTPADLFYLDGIKDQVTGKKRSFCFKGYCDCATQELDSTIFAVFFTSIFPIYTMSIFYCRRQQGAPGSVRENSDKTTKRQNNLNSTVTGQSMCPGNTLAQVFARRSGTTLSNYQANCAIFLSIG